MKIEILILIFLNLSLTLLEAIKWNGNSASSCDFIGGDVIRSTKISLEECKTSCTKEIECTHYTWERSMCKLKSGSVNKNDALSVNDKKKKCGIVERSDDGHKCEIYDESDFEGENIIMKDGDIEVFKSNEELKLNSIRSLRIAKNCRMKLCFKKSWSQCEHYTHDFEFKSDKPLPAMAMCNCGPNLLIEASKGKSAGSTVIQFKKIGKGTIRFAIKPLSNSEQSFDIQIGNENVRHKLTFKDKDVKLKGESAKYKRKEENKAEVSLTHFNASESYLWISIDGYLEDPKNNIYKFIKVGYGYAMEKNLLFSFYPQDNKTKAFISSIDYIDIDKKVAISQSNSYVNFIPFYRDQKPTLVESASMQMLSSGYILPSDLPPVGQRLFNTIRNMSLDSELVDAINFSLDNEGCLLHTKLVSKTGFVSKNSKSSYIRVSLNTRTFSAPGLPLVLEIWPKGHSSPVHNHGDCVAVIKLLSGSLTSDFYNPLSSQSFIKPVKINSYQLHASNFTWMTPDYYQTHLLYNHRNDTAAITIQSYSHLEDAESHDEKFNYIVPESPELKHFYPGSDFIYDDSFDSILRRELKTKKCKSRKNTVVKCNFKGRKCGSLLKDMDAYRADPSIKDNALYYCEKSGQSLKMLRICPNKYECSANDNMCTYKNPSKAFIQIEGINNGDISGFLELEEIKLGEIVLMGQINGLKAKSIHGFHIYESKDCNDLGPHFDPYMTDKHGDLNSHIVDKHLGDLGNIIADSEGTANVTRKLFQMTIDEETEFNILGRAVAITENKDDLGKTGLLESNLNGNSGEIIACGTIVHVNTPNAPCEVCDIDDHDLITFDPEEE